MIKKVTLTSLSLLIIFHFCVAQIHTNTLTGKIENVDFEKNSKIIIKTYGFNQVRQNRTPIAIYTESINNNGDFKINFSVNESNFYLEIEALSGERSIELSKIIGSTPYLSESGDSIHLSVNTNRKTANFIGKGADKLNLQYLVNRVPMLFELNGPYYFDKTKFNKRQILNTELKMLNHFMDTRNEVIKSYQELLPTNIYNRIKIDKMVEIKYHFVHNILFQYLLGGSDENKKQIEDYIKTSGDNDTIFKRDDSLEQAPGYPDFLLDYERLNYLVSGSHKQNPKPYFDWMYNNIKMQYSGVLRDNLIIAFILKTNNRYSKSQLQILPEAIELMTAQENITFLKNYEKKQTSGKKAYPFIFQDTTGKKHFMSDYKNKIMVIDFWFTGCHGCMKIPPIMKVIMDKFKQNTEVIFLSVSVDSTKKKWFSGLKSENYTSPGQIHLKTNGAGQLDTFIINYNIHSYPKLMIIGKNGVLLSAGPTDPRSDKGEDIIKIVQNALDR